MKPLCKSVVGGLLLILLGGCSATTTIDEYRPSSQPIVLDAMSKSWC